MTRPFPARSVLISFLMIAGMATGASAQAVKNLPLGSDSKFTALAPMEQLKKLAELNAAKTVPVDFDALRKNAARRYLHAESKGKPADELKAYQKLTSATKEGGPLAGLSFDTNFDSPFVDYAYCAALLADPIWQAGDAKAKLELLAEWERNSVQLQNTTSYIAEWVILEHLAQKTAALPVKQRGDAKLKALAELASGNPLKENFADSPGANWLWNEALAEYFAFAPNRAAVSPADRLTLLVKFYADIKINRWAGLNEEFCAVRDALRVDPRFIAAADLPAKKKVAATFITEQKVRSFTGQSLQNLIDGKEEHIGKGPKIDDLAAALGSTADPEASLKKLRDLASTNSIAFTDYYAAVMPLALRYALAGDPDKPAINAAEIAKWRTMRDGGKAILKAVPLNTSGPVDLPALAGAIVSNPAYGKASWLNRLAMLEKVQAAYPEFGSPLWRGRQVFTRFALVTETASVTPAARGEAELRVLQKMRAADSNAQLQDATLHELVRVAIDDHFSEHPAPPKAKFAQITLWLNAKLLTFEIAEDAIAQIAAEMLEADPTFMSANPVAKKARIEQMIAAKQLDFFSSNDIKRHFKID